MTIKVKEMTSQHESDYEAFLDEYENSLLYYSLSYRKFLLKTLNNTESKYLLAFNNNKIVAVFPLIIKHLKSKKTIINALPFYGSHGGVIIDKNFSHKSQEIMNNFFFKLSDLTKKYNTISLTIITPPLKNSDQEIISQHYSNYFGQKPADQRINQMTNISVESGLDVEKVLMSRFHSKTRNMVRKALKAEFDINHDEQLSSFEELCQLHHNNMKIIGGKAKSMRVFKNIYKTFSPNKDYRIYRASMEGKTAAMMLILYYKNYCEYFTPVINKTFRFQQPLSAIIFNAMCEASKQNYSLWNWGGTWESQESVHFFKKRWGAEDLIYYYYNKIFDKKYVLENINNIIKEAENFYVLPYSKIEDLADECN